METKRVLVIGGTGYIGRSLVSALLNENYAIVLLIQKKRDIPLVPSKCSYFLGDLREKDSFSLKLRNFDIIINLASIVRSFNKQRYSENVMGVKNLVEIMKKNKLDNLVYFSTQNIHLKNKGPYAKSKLSSEEVIKKSGINYLIIRPNFVYGIDKKNYFYQLSKMIKNLHILPIIGSGNHELQPVLKEDLTKTVTKLIAKPFDKDIIEISGSETISLNDIILNLEKSLKTKAIKFHVPPTILLPFKILLPFDLEGFTESRISLKPYLIKSNLWENLKKIAQLNH